MKNEKVALVFLSYVIGFTTAFIAFAINDNGYSKDEMTSLKKHQEIVTHNDKLQPQSHDDVEIVNRPDGLYMLNGDDERILSATAADGVSGEGFHTEIFAASVSPSGQYIYFCASLIGEAEICTNFVYSVTDDLIYKVRAEEELLKLNREEAEVVSWMEDDTLSFPTGSASMATNWSIR